MDEFADSVTEEALKKDVESVQEESEEIESIEEEIEDESEDVESLPFAKAEVVRLMKKNLSRDKLIQKE